MFLSERVGKIPIDISDRFSGERCVRFFCLPHHVQNSKRVRPYFAQIFGLGRPISDHPFFIGDADANVENESELQRGQTNFCPQREHLFHRLCATSKAQGRYVPATLQDGF
jgi:hypothetical protein